MAYTLRSISAAGDESDTHWPGDEESARRHAIEQVRTGKAASAHLLDKDGAALFRYPE